MNKLTVCLIAALLLSAPATAREPPPAAPARDAIRMFLDCSHHCDESFLRKEITFVDWMRDRKDADVHVLVTTQSTGGGGTEFTIKFIGLGRFAGVEQTLKHVATTTSTSDEIRRGIADVLKRGLVRYVSESALAPRLKISFEDPKAGAAAADPKKDPWNLWVFRTGFSGSLSGEQSTKYRSFRSSASANRTTDDWRLSFSASGSYSSNLYDLSETETFRSISRNLDGSALAVKSLTQHWSLGLLGNASKSTRIAQKRDTRKPRKHFFENSQLPNGKFRIVVGDPGNVPSWTRERGCEAKSDRVSNQGRDDRDCLGCSLGGVCWRAAVACDDIDACGNEFGGKRRKPFQLSFGETGFNYKIGALNIA